MSVKPITPEQALNSRENYFPDYVIQAFNKVIAKNFNGKKSQFKLDEIINQILVEGMGQITRTQIFADRLLDVESIYEKHGWKVYYDSPGYNESYDANFTFTKKYEN